MGKGSTRRPSSVPPAVEADNWARTFGGKPQHDLDAQREQGCATPIPPRTPLIDQMQKADGAVPWRPTL